MSTLPDTAAPARQNSMPVLGSLMILVVTGLADWFTGYRFNFYIFYFIPIAFASWYTGKISTYAITVSAAVSWFLCDLFTNPLHPEFVLSVWNILVTAASFMVLAFALSEFRREYIRERETNAKLVEAMSHIKQLRDLLPICANCKKIRNDDGYWEQVETYFQENSDIAFTHSFCPECVRKLYPEIADTKS
jgi:hypothetical protein